MTKQRRILVISDFGTTGISESVRAPLIHFHEQGHEIWQLALGYNGWSPSIDRKMYPWWERVLPMFGGNDPATKFGQSSIRAALEMAKPDIVFTSLDAWMVGYISHPDMHRATLDDATYKLLDRSSRTFTHVGYFPLDGAVQNKYLTTMLSEIVCGIDVPVTYSRYAQQIMRNDLNIEVPFIPIAHDPAIYHPGNKAEARKSLGIPEKGFIIGMVATNQYRKLFNEFLEASFRVARRHKDVFILPWTTWDHKMMGGNDVSDLVWRSDLAEQVIRPGDQVGSLTDEGMATLYRALDVHVLTTVGEGAGLPPLRARASGIPSLVSANTSNIEFTSSEFELIPTKAITADPFGGSFERYTTDVDVLEDRLEQLYRDPMLRRRIGKAGIAEMKQYEVANVLPMWDAVIEGIA